MEELDELKDMKKWERMVYYFLLPLVYLYAKWTLLRIKIGVMPPY